MSDTAERGGSDLELIQFVTDLQRSMLQVADYLSVRHPDREMRMHFGDIQRSIYERSSLLIEALAGISDDLFYHLESHGLTRGPERDLKLAGFRRANRRFQSAFGHPHGPLERPSKRADATFDDPPPRIRSAWHAFKAGARRTLSSVGGAIQAQRRRLVAIPAARTMLKWANILLGSLGAFAGAGALKEIKDAEEAALDEL
jgi:hypothetical protein